VDYSAQSVSTVVGLGTPTAAQSTGQTRQPTHIMAPKSMVLAATASAGTDGSAAGSYAATSLKPSGSWSQGGDSGSFTYTYPVTLPAASTSLAPSVSLAYDSGSVDGQTSMTAAQSSWIGDGWSSPDSYIEQTFATCSDNPEGSAAPVSTSDACYDGPILTVSLNGSSTALVCNSAETSCTPADDNGETVQHVTSSGNGTNTYNTDYWIITERNGTKYEFGRNQLPGWASGKAATNSVDYEPVFSAHSSGDPCYNATWSSSVCNMAYRWHLDYVVDTHSQAMAYYYNQATNYYGENNGAKVVPYVRDSTLAEIDYGFTDGGAYGTVPDKVAFSPLARCVQSTCDSLSSITATQAATEYPDVPFDLYCPTASCSAPSQAPGFFSTVRLGSISTQQYSTASSTYKTIDSYVLTQTEPATHDATASTLWLNSIQRTGSDTSAGGSGASITLPAVTFAGTDLANRVDMTNFPGLYRFRVNAITTETGSVIGVTYGTPNTCSVAYVQAQTASSASSNTNSCFPVNWTPTGYTNPVLDWFEKYAVTQVLVSDATTGALTEETDYQYTGGAAWHYDDNEVVKAKYRTYGQFRGYATVTTRTGQLANNPQTESATTYYRGMNGDWLSSTSSRSVTLTDSQGGTHVDDNALAGKALETTGYLGDGGPVDHSTISSYWVSSVAASRTRSGLPTLIAVTSAAAETWNRQALTDGGNTTWRITETDDTYDASTSDANFGLLEYAYTHTVPVNAAYDSCAATTYAAPNTSENLVGLVASTETDSVACGGFTEGATSSAPAGLNTLTAPTTVSRPAQVESATQTFYDDATFATTFPQPSTPTVGNVTMTRKAADYTGGAFVWQTEKRATYDSYGRPLNVYDADGNETVTSYTANSVGLTTAESVALPTTSGIAHTTSTTLDPTRALTLTSTDQNGVVTTQHYDALGRLTSVWLDSRATSAAANQTYSYTVSQTGLSGVTGQKLNDESSYITTVTIDDSLGRTRQVQTQTPKGGRLINDTFYDTHGWTYKKNNNYWDPGVTPTLQLMGVDDKDVPNQDDYVFDGLGRTVEDQSKNDSRLVSTSTTVYNGDSTTVIPPTGGAWKTTTTDPLGRTRQLLEYTADPALSTPANTFTGIFSISGGTPVVTSYGYDGHGQQNTVTDSANNTWTTTYNLLGQATSKSDPDAGTSSLSYDANGNLLQSTDARGKIVSYTYDALGRKTGEYAAATTAQTAGPSGNQLAAWVYDNANNAVTGMTYPIGQQTTATSYAGGYAYTEQSSGFNVFGESLGTRVIIPSGAQGTVLGKTWTFGHSYSTTTGLLAGDSYPSGAGLPLESTNHTYTTALDLPNGSGSGLAGYAQTTSYTAYGQVEQATIGGLTTNQAYITNSYDPHTSKLTDQLVTRDVATPTNVDEQSYTYDLYGNITNQVSTRLGATATTETQCYQYDALDRLTTAWTATDSCATVPTTSSYAMVGDNLATASAYWTSWSIDNLGDVISETDHSTTGGADTTKAYGYNGNNANQPHTLTAASITGGTTASNSYTYDQAGNMITRATAGQGNQSLTWNAAGQVTQISNGTNTSSFIYDANGNILLEQDPGSTVLYLPGEQVTLNTATQTATGARYYPLPGGAIAVRTGTGTNYYFEVTNPQGTGDLYLDSTAQTPTWRQFTPYGAPRGTTTTWIDNHGFLNKPTDATTGLTIVGAREYDPTTGRFVSLDPVFEANDPQALNGYAYTDANPINSIDPSGQRAAGDGDGSTCNNEGQCSGEKSDGPSACAVDPMTPGCPEYNDTAELNSALGDLYDAIYGARLHPTHHHASPLPQAATLAAGGWAFGQRRVGPGFSAPVVVDGKKYYTIEDLAAAIKSGDVSVDDIQIEAFKQGDVSVSLSNRRFTALVRAGKLPTNVLYRDPTNQELRRLNETSVLGEDLPSHNMAVTPNMKSDEVLYTVSLSDIVGGAVDNADSEAAAEAAAAAQARAAAQAEAEAEAQQQAMEEAQGEAEAMAMAEAMAFEDG
jgi:RHS repeat-associated protein